MYKVEIYAMDHTGRGIGKLNNKIIFVKYALQGEEVLVKITKEVKKYYEGVVTKIIKSSKDRVEAICPYFTICGGCQLLNLSYNGQLEYKQEKIENIFHRYFSEEVLINKIIPTQQYNYRNKVVFKVKNNKCGYYKDKSNEFVKIDQCLLLNTNINTSIQKINLEKLEEICIRTSEYNNKIIFQENDQITEKLGSKLYQVSLSSFFQVNTKGANILYDKVLSSLGSAQNKKVLDLFCGTGTIGIYIADHVGEVIGIDINKSNIENANYNKKLNNIKNIDFKEADASTIKNDNYDIVIVDPPREGLSETLIVKLLKMNLEKIIYVSCDPMTLVRDLNLLKNKYFVKEITPIDMFPNTYHVECVCTLNCR